MMMLKVAVVGLVWWWKFGDQVADDLDNYDSFDDGDDDDDGGGSGDGRGGDSWGDHDLYDNEDDTLG